MKNWILILFCIVFNASFGQVAIIQDNDGYSNVRFARNSKSEIIYKLKTSVVFFYVEDEYNNETKEWVKVLIPKNKFSLDCPSKYIEGYIHKSRIKPLKELDKFNGSNFSFKLKSIPFEKEDKIIDYVDKKYVFSINGLVPFGIDGNIPKLEIEQIDITLNDKKIDVSSALIMDLFECKDNATVYKVDTTYFVYQNCSDGAGFYELVWAIDEKGINQRLVGLLY